MRESLKGFLNSSFLKTTGLDLKKINKDTEEDAAVCDALVIAGKRQRIYWESVCSVNIDGGFCFREKESTLLEDIKKVTDGKSGEYLGVFKSTNEWLSRSFCDDYMATSGQRFRFVCDSLGKNWDEIMNGNDLPGIRQVGKEKV